MCRGEEDHRADLEGGKPIAERRVREAAGESLAWCCGSGPAGIIPDNFSPHKNDSGGGKLNMAEERQLTDEDMHISANHQRAGISERSTDLTAKPGRYQSGEGGTAEAEPEPRAEASNTVREKIFALWQTEITPHQRKTKDNNHRCFVHV